MKTMYKSFLNETDIFRTILRHRNMINEWLWKPWFSTSRKQLYLSLYTVASSDKRSGIYAIYAVYVILNRLWNERMYIPPWHSSVSLVVFQFPCSANSGPRCMPLAQCLSANIGAVTWPERRRRAFILASAAVA